MPSHQFASGQVLQYKPYTFAPLQATPGGPCTVITALQTDNGERLYRIRLNSDSREIVVREEDIGYPTPPPLSGANGG